MKSRHATPPLYALVLPPLAALLLVAGLRARQSTELEQLRGNINRDDTAISLLRSHLADPRRETDPAGMRPMNPAKIDWRKMAQVWNGAPDPQGRGPSEMDGFRLRSQVFTWSAETLLAALDQIDKSDLSGEERQVLVMQLESALSYRDPAAMLARFDRHPAASSDKFNNPVRQALGKLSMQDPAAAIAWMDRQIAAGRLNPARMDGSEAYEGALIRGLAASDYAAAVRRLTTYPPELRPGVLSAAPRDLPGMRDFARLARETLPPESVPTVLVNATSTALGSFAFSAALLDQIAATPAERLAMAEQMTARPFSLIAGSRDLNEGDFRDLQAWMTTQAPDRANELTAKAMAVTIFRGIGGDSGQLAGLILKYDPDGSNQLLTPFLKQMAVLGRLPEVAPLVDQVADPVQRQELRDALR